MRVHLISDVHGRAGDLATAAAGADALFCLGDLLLFVDYADNGQGIFAELFGADAARQFVELRTAKRFGWRRSHTSSTPVAASAKSATRSAGSGTGSLQGARAPRTAGTRNAPAARDFVHRYAETFQPHELRCCSRAAYVRRGAPATSSPGSAADRAEGGGPCAHM